MAGRQAGYRHTQKTRDKIQASQLINRLYGCAMGEAELSAQQVNAAKALLNKVLPDLQSVEIDVDLEADIKTVNRVELVALADDSSADSSSA